MQCVKCNSQLKDGQSFCGACGFKIDITGQNSYSLHEKTDNQLIGMAYQQNMDQTVLSNQVNNSQMSNNQVNYSQQVDKQVEVKKSAHKEKKKKKKHGFLKFLLFIFIVFLIAKGVNAYKNTLNKIYLTNSEIYGKKDTENFYKVEEKIEEIELKVKTFKKVEKTTIKLSAYNLVLFEKEYTNEKKWSIDDVSLPIGSSDLEVEVTLDNGGIIRRKITFYNVNEDNLGSLDTDDSDSDQLLNYQEEIYGTNKNMVDTDNDSLSDYQEVLLTMTDPTKYSTYEGGISDALADYDSDGLNNSEEIGYGTNPVMEDTDNDGLNDYDEVIVFKTDFLKSDTDEDDVSDYDEVKNFNSNPLTKTDVFSGKVQSQNREVGITLNNITLADIDKTVISETAISVLNENMIGYIMPAYDITTDVQFTSSELSFNFDGYELEDGAVPTIYYYNNETGALEELPTRIVGKTATTTVTHFSTYVLVDKNKFGNINQIDVGSSEVEVSEKINGQFVFYYSPILAVLFNNPVYVIASPDLSEAQGEVLKRKIVDSFDDSGYGNVNLTITDSRTTFNMVRDIFNMIDGLLYDFLVDTIGSSLISTAPGMTGDSYAHNMNNCLIIGYVERVEELGIVFVGADEENIFEDSYVYIDLTVETDTNKDGISDAFTKAILGGAITTSTGINPFEGYTLSQIQETDDLDGDGLKNDEEIEIVEENGKYVIKMHSDPRLVDSDNDGLDDNEDESPLYAIIPGFAIGKSLGEDLNLSWYEKEVESYNSLFGTGKVVKKEDNKEYIEYVEDGVTKLSPTDFNAKGDVVNGIVTIGAWAGNVYGAGDANKAWKRYNDATGETYTEDDLVEDSIKRGKINSNSIYGSEDVQGYIKINSNRLINIVEDQIKVGDTKVIKSVKSLTASGKLNDAEANKNTFGFLNNSSAHMIAEATNKDGEYIMKLRYFIIDIYDWKSSEECNVETSPACAAEVDYYNDMLIGKGKAFLVKLEYDMEVTWEKGKSPSITLLEGTPYAS